jgi:aminopeptidase N
MRAIVRFAALLAVPFLVAAASASGSAPGCDRALLEADVRYFASDELAGRGLGSPGLDQALRAVAQRFADLGLVPAYPERVTAADPLAGYLQPFTSAGQPASANVIGVLPGADAAGAAAPGAGASASTAFASAPPAPRTVVIGAHVDHLGRDNTLTGDQIYNGADDNASGVAALLAIAQTLTALPPGGRDRSVLFIAFSGEEPGLLGSKYYIEHPVVPASDVLAMINLDTIGRLRSNQLFVFGSGTAGEFPALLEGLNQAFGFDLVLQSSGAGASDQTSFFAQSVPVLHFFTGPHEDYHRVTDTADKLDYAGLAAVTDYVTELMRYLRYRDRPLTFVAAGAKQVEQMKTLAASGERRVSLGFIPDFTQERGGVKVGPVTPGGAAARAGLVPGDVIVAINDEATDTLVDYTGVLRQHAPGERVRLSVRRGGATLTIEAELQERK